MVIEFYTALLWTQGETVLQLYPRLRNFHGLIGKAMEITPIKPPLTADDSLPRNFFYFGRHQHLQSLIDLETYSGYSHGAGFSAQHCATSSARIIHPL